MKDKANNGGSSCCGGCLLTRCLESTRCLDGDNAPIESALRLIGWINGAARCIVNIHLPGPGIDPELRQRGYNTQKWTSGVILLWYGYLKTHS